MANIIIKGKSSGNTRSEHEQNLRSSGFGSTLTNEQLDKCKYLEKKVKESTGAKNSFFNPVQIDQIK